MLRRAAVVGALVLSVAGCNGGGEPGGPPTPTASSPSASATATPTPSASPSPSGPDIPAAAREQTDAGAEAFVEYFFDQFNVAWTEPRPGLIRSLSDPECQFCKKTEDTAQYLSDNGERYASDPADLRSVELFGGAPEGEQFTEVRMTQNEADIVDKNGKVLATDPRKSVRYYVTLRWRGDRWWLLELEKTQ